MGQVISKTCGISKKQIFKIKETVLYNFEQRSWSSLILRFFCRPLPQPLTLDMILAEYKPFLDFSVMKRSNWVNCPKKLRFYYKWWNKKMQVYQNNLRLTLCLNFYILSYYIFQYIFKFFIVIFHLTMAFQRY